MSLLRKLFSICLEYYEKPFAGLRPAHVLAPQAIFHLQALPLASKCIAYSRKTVFLRFRQKNKPVRVSNAISSSANYAGELAPMRFRRLPGVTGPCPSTTLDKSFIYFLRYCTKAGFLLSTKIHKKKIPFPKFASLHRRNPQKRLFFRYFSAITVLFPARTRR